MPRSAPGDLVELTELRLARRFARARIARVLEAGRERILASCRALVPAVDEMTPIRSFAGVRPVSSTGGYVIRPSTAGDRLTIVAGIRSTGISASPGIAEAADAFFKDKPEGIVRIPDKSGTAVVRRVKNARIIA